MQKKYATGRPDQKDLNENLAATQGLAHMIIECNRLFEVREPVVEMMQGFQAWMQYPLAFPLCEVAVNLISFFFTPIRSLMRWLLSRVIHTWRLTCMHRQLKSCASIWRMAMERTKLTWRGDIRAKSKRPGIGPNAGCPAAALMTQSSTTRRLVFLL